MLFTFTKATHSVSSEKNLLLQSISRIAKVVILQIGEDVLRQYKLEPKDDLHASMLRYDF